MARRIKPSKDVSPVIERFLKFSAAEDMKKPAFAFKEREKVRAEVRLKVEQRKTEKAKQERIERKAERKVRRKERRRRVIKHLKVSPKTSKKFYKTLRKRPKISGVVSRKLGKRFKKRKAGKPRITVAQQENLRRQKYLRDMRFKEWKRRMEAQRARQRPQPSVRERQLPIEQMQQAQMREQVISGDRVDNSIHRTPLPPQLPEFFVDTELMTGRKVLKRRVRRERWTE